MTKLLLKEKNDVYFMNIALLWAKWAAAQGEVPVGAVLVKDNAIIASGFNQTIQTNDPTAHAEIIALRKAALKLQNYRLIDTTLYISLEPCVMCVGALIHARIKRVVFAASDFKTGAAGSVFSLLNSPFHNHHIAVTKEILQQESSHLLKQFFKNKR